MTKGQLAEVIIRHCQNCGSEFKLNKRYQKYCSEDCRAEYNRKNRVCTHCSAPLYCANCGSKI